MTSSEDADVVGRIGTCKRKDVSQGESSSMSSDVPDKKRGRKKVSSKNYEQQIDFSKASELEIRKSFRCYAREGVPTSQSIGLEIDAVTWEEVVNELVQDLNMKGAYLSVASSDDLLQKCPPSLFQSSEHNMLSDFSQVIQILGQLSSSNFDCTTSENTMKVLDKLHHLIDDWNDSSGESDDFIGGTRNYLIRKVLLALKDFSDLASQEETSSALSQTRIHDALSRFIAELVDLSTYEYWRDEITARTTTSGYSMRFVMKKAENTSDIDDEAVDVTRRVPVTFSGKPDILCTRVQKHPRDHRTKYTIAPLVIQVKSTTRCSEKDPCHMTSASGTEATAERSGGQVSTTSPTRQVSRSTPTCRVLHSPSTPCLSDPDQYTSRQINNPNELILNSGLEDLPQQHFLEMIACLKTFSPMVKVFGMYVVMNRVYFTCMVVCDEQDKAPKHPQLIRDFVRINDVKDFLHTRENPLKLRYKQICSKWLNFLNPVHLKAILCFIRFILVHEQKYTDIYHFGAS